jgi:hypothetical protein
MRQDSRVRQNGSWFYQRCVHRWHNGKDACTNGKNFNVTTVEPPVWQFVSNLLKDPAKVRMGLDALIERERKGVLGDPSREVKIWLDKLAEADRMRRGYQEQTTKGLMTLDELEEHLKRIEEVRKAAQEELVAIEGCCQRLEELEHDRDALLERYAGMVPEALDSLGPEERHRIYKMLRLKVLAYPEARFEVSGVLGAGPAVCLYEPSWK